MPNQMHEMVPVQDCVTHKALEDLGVLELVLLRVFEIVAMPLAVLVLHGAERVI